MSKTKDKIEEDKEFANKELESQESKQGYYFDEVNHVHLLNGQPLIGTSSMSSVLAKGGLTYWASGLAVSLFGWINKGNAKTGWIPKTKRLATAIAQRNFISDFSDEDYLQLLDDAYMAHTKKLKDSAKDGTDMHAIMESYVKMCIDTNNGIPLNILDSTDTKLNIFIDWSLKHVKRFLWSEVHCYSEKMWLGGISDCGFEDKDGKTAILDFKSSKDVYLPQFWQCIGYAIQLEENGGLTRDGVKLFKLNKPIDYVAVLPFGMEKPEVQYNYDMAGGKEAVSAMLLLYKKLPH